MMIALWKVMLIQLNNMTENFFKNRNIIVAGASSGVGRETAIALSKLGANVILVSRNEKKLDAVLLTDLVKGEHSKFVFDFEKTENISDLLNQIMSLYDSIDGLVYSAGTSKRVRFKNLTTDVLDSVMRVNFYSFVELIRGIVSKKRKDNELRIVGVSSLASSENAKFFLPYAASKNALESSVRILSNELKGQNVFISGIKPAYIDTPFIASNNDIYGDFNKYLTEGYQPYGLIPTHVISEAICFLLGSNAKYYSGSCVKIPAGVCC